MLFAPNPKERSKSAYLWLVNVRMRAILAGCQCNFLKGEDNLVLATGPYVRLVRARGLTWLLNFAARMAALPATSLISRALIHRRWGDLHEDGLLKLDILFMDGVWDFSLLPPSPVAQSMQ
jgi:hypothetical protein